MTLAAIPVFGCHVFDAAACPSNPTWLSALAGGLVMPQLGAIGTVLDHAPSTRERAGTAAACEVNL